MILEPSFVITFYEIEPSEFCYYEQAASLQICVEYFTYV